VRRVATVSAGADGQAVPGPVPDLCCRIVTPFAPDGALDLDACGPLVERFADARIAVYLGSGGSGEGHALAPRELSDLYAAAVRKGAGRIPVYANPPEQHTVSAAIMHAQLAVEAGVELVNVYGPAGWHGYQATAEEYLAYFDEVLPAVRVPVALCPNPGLGYAVAPDTVAEVCARHPGVAAVNLNGVPLAYLARLRELTGGQVRLYADDGGLRGALPAGAAGIVSALPNLIPGTFRRYVDAVRCHRADEEADLYGQIQRLRQYGEQWPGGTPRWIKLALHALHLPGGRGGPRPPYLPLTETAVRQFLADARNLHIPEITDMLSAVTPASSPLDDQS
jgi:4-hydroxy-tetrahydrodipicolinate synthase